MTQTVDGAQAGTPYVYDVILQCRECDRINDRGDSVRKLSRFRSRARVHAGLTGHEVEVIVGKVYPYLPQRRG